MKAKTEDELRAEIVKKLEADLKMMLFIFSNTLGAVTTATAITLLTIPDSHEVMAAFTTNFYAQVQQMAKLDGVKLAENYLDLLGFDECTIEIIKSRIPDYVEMY